MINKIEVKGAAVFAATAAPAVDRLPAWQAEIAHHLPGRLRLRSAELKGDARAAEQARRHLAELEGVMSVTANPYTGSLLLEYDPTIVAPDKLLDALATRGHIAVAAEECIDAGGGWSDKLVSVIKDCLIDALAERLALAVFSALV